jgi:transposase
MQMRELFNTPKGYKISNFENNPESLDIHIEPYKKKKAICSGCGEIHTKGYHGFEIIKVRDLPAVGRKVYLHVKKRQYVCPKDGKIYVEQIDWIKKKEDIPIDLLKMFTV